MPLLTNRRIATQELPEFPFVGPFGGIQSELPLNQIENYGFYDCVNIALRNGVAQSRPGSIMIDPLPNPPVAMMDFFNAYGIRQTVVLTRSTAQRLSGASWFDIPGFIGNGNDNKLFSWTVVANQLLFSDGVNKVQYYDGLVNAINVVPDSVPARFMFELNTHLIIARTFEGGVDYTQRVRWTPAGLPFDFTSPGAGINNVLNSCGPINGAARVYQNGFLLHYEGITRMIPTGIGTAPFSFVSYNDHTRGCFFPNSVASFGDNGFAYATRNDILFFDGTNFMSIGALPVDDGRKFVGARTRIMADLLSVSPDQVFGFAFYGVSNNLYDSYWLVIPGKSIWIFNRFEKNWTRFTYQVPAKMVGFKVSSGNVLWEDLVDTWEFQNWTWEDGAPVTGFDRPLIGFSDGTASVPDFDTPCELTSQIISGDLCMGDRRHLKRITALRVVYVDDVSAEIDFNFESDEGEVSQAQINIVGGGTGKTRIVIAKPDITGTFIRWTMTIPPNSKVKIAEVTPIYNIESEVR